jgi:predicted DsbA family dithiol-disulfide isomerase
MRGAHAFGVGIEGDRAALPAAAEKDEGKRDARRAEPMGLHAVPFVVAAPNAPAAA